MMISTKKNWLAVLTLLCARVAFPGDIAGVELTGVDSDRIVKIKFNGTVVIPKAYSKKMGDEVALDFPAAKNLVARNLLEYNDPILARISLAELNQTTQVKVKLKQNSNFRLTKKGNEIWLYINPLNKAAVLVNKSPAAPVPTGQYAVKRQDETSELPAAGGNNLVGLDFKRKNDNDALIVFTVNNLKETPQIKKLPGKLQLTLKNYNPQASTQNVYDVTEFNTLVKKIDVKKQGLDAVITIFTAGGKWNYDLERNAARLTVTVSQDQSILADDSGKAPIKHYQGGRLSLDFQNIDVRTILQILAKEGKVNIIASDTVAGKLTLKLSNVRWDEALDIVLKNKNLGMRQIGSVINVAPKTEFEAQDRQELNMERDQIEMGGLQSRAFQLKYKNAADFQKMITDANSGTGNSMLSKRGSVMIDNGTNTVIVTDIPANIKKFERMLQQIDIARDQVMISARIVEVRDNYARNLGIRLNTLLNRDHGRTGFGGATSGQNDSKSGSNDNNLPANINVPLQLGTTQAFSGFTIARSTDSAFISLAITAMQEEGQAKIVSTPNVLALNGEEALLEDGVDVGYRVNQGQDEGYTIQYRRAVTSLKVTPRITPDGNVILDLEVNKDGVLQENSISVKKLTTRAMVEDGGTLIIGGIYDESDSLNANKIPVLSDIPVIGKAFTTKNRSREKRQVLVFVTPKIIRGPGL